MQQTGSSSTLTDTGSWQMKGINLSFASLKVHCGNIKVYAVERKLPFYLAGRCIG